MAKAQHLQARDAHAHRKRIVFVTVVAVVLAGVAGYLWYASRPMAPAVATKTDGINLLASGWGYQPGVEPRDDGLHVSYLGRSIVQQDGSDGQANPSVNSYGTHLHADGDFEMTAALKDVHGSASLRLYEHPPIIQDEFRVEPRSTEFKVETNKLTVSSWPDYSNQDLYNQVPTSSSQYSISTNALNTITLQRQGGRTTLLMNGQYIADAAKYSLPGNDLWIGLSANNTGDSWTLASLVAKGLSGNNVSAVDTQNAPAIKKDAQGLQTLASQKHPGFLVGAAMALTPLVDDAQYAAVALGGNFGSMTTENALKWQFIHPQKNTYDFREADALIDIAKKNGLSVHGHTLIFGEANPPWVRDMPVATANDKAAVAQTMLDHITKTVDHFKGRIASWDVVNEPFADINSTQASNSLRQRIWYQAMGEDYIAAAFRAAHQADPSAKLYINDFGLEEDGDRWTAMLALVTKLKAQGVPIDGVGFEAHVYQAGDEINPMALRSHIKSLAAIGMSSRVSEMDVYSDNGAAAQAQQYADVFGTCLSEPSCVSWSSWGVTDRYDMLQSDTNRLQHGQDLLWDTNIAPTQAVDRIRQTILQ